MARTIVVRSEGELDALLRAIREGGTSTLEGLDDLMGLSRTVDARSEMTGKLPRQLQKIAKSVPGVDKAAAKSVKRMAMGALNNPLLQTGMKYAPLVGAGLAAGDVLLGDESIGNKAMDVGLMTAGGIAGSVVPVVGTGLGITGGKLISDLTQYLLGGGME